jgi:hypothetical protein
MEELEIKSFPARGLVLHKNRVHRRYSHPGEAHHAKRWDPEEANRYLRSVLSPVPHTPACPQIDPGQIEMSHHNKAVERTV